MLNHRLHNTPRRSRQIVVQIRMLPAHELSVAARHLLNGHAEDGSAASINRDGNLIKRDVGEAGEGDANLQLDRMLWVEIVFNRRPEEAGEGQHAGVFARAVVMQGGWLLACRLQ